MGGEKGGKANDYSSSLSVKILVCTHEGRKKTHCV